jgi:hypothetical protein
MNGKLGNEPVLVFQLHIEVITLEKRICPVDDIGQFSSLETVVCVIGNPCLKTEKRVFTEGGSTIKERLVHAPNFSDVGVCGNKPPIWKHESEVKSGILFEGRNEGAGFHKILFGIFANDMACLTSLTALLQALIEFDEVDATEEFEEARTGDPVKDAHPTLFTLQQTCATHHSKMLRKRRDITPCKIREIVHTFFALCEDVHNKQTRRMGHRFDDDRPVFGRKA